MPRPLCRFFSDAFPEPFMRGFAETFDRYGSLLDTLAVEFVEGFMYNQVRPVGAPPDAVGHPPREVWDSVLSQLPPIQARLATAEQVLADKQWRADLIRWDTEIKPALAAHRQALRDVELTSLTDEALADHVDQCRAALVDGLYNHHRHNAAAILPVGLFLATALPVTARGPGDLLGLLMGASPVTQGYPQELETLRVAVAGEPTAVALLADESADPAAVLATLRSWGGEIGPAAISYLDLAGEINVDSQDSVGSPAGSETPELLLARVRAALRPPLPDSSYAAEQEIRGTVPAEHLAEFDEALAEARLVYRLRDERSVYGDRPAGSLCRRALLEVGRRLVERGAIAEPENAVDATAAEVRALLQAEPDAPTGAELADRAAWRRTAGYRDMPPLFGPPPGPPLPADWLPLAAARVHTALGISIGAILFEPEASTTESSVTGLAVSPGSHVGRAVVVRTPDDLQRVKAGDVLVAASTGPAFNLVLSRVGAIVTDRGGLLSHAAIVAREFGVPAVVGCSDATLVIQDGDRVRVDGVSGVVTVL